MSQGSIHERKKGLPNRESRFDKHNTDENITSLFNMSAWLN